MRSRNSNSNKQIKRFVLLFLLLLISGIVVAGTDISFSSEREANDELKTKRILSKSKSSKQNSKSSKSGSIKSSKTTKTTKVSTSDVSYKSSKSTDSGKAKTTKSGKDTNYDIVTTKSWSYKVPKDKTTEFTAQQTLKDPDQYFKSSKSKAKASKSSKSRSGWSYVMTKSPKSKVATKDTKSSPSNKSTKSEKSNTKSNKSDKSAKSSSKSVKSPKSIYSIVSNDEKSPKSTKSTKTSSKSSKDAIVSNDEKSPKSTKSTPKVSNDDKSPKSSSKSKSTKTSAKSSKDTKSPKSSSKSKSTKKSSKVSKDTKSPKSSSKSKSTKTSTKSSKDTKSPKSSSKSKSTKTSSKSSKDTKSPKASSKSYKSPKSSSSSSSKSHKVSKVPKQTPSPTEPTQDSNEPIATLAPTQSPTAGSTDVQTNLNIDPQKQSQFVLQCKESTGTDQTIRFDVAYEIDIDPNIFVVNSQETTSTVLKNLFNSVESAMLSHLSLSSGCPLREIQLRRSAIRRLVLVGIQFMDNREIVANTCPSEPSTTTDAGATCNVKAINEIQITTDTEQDISTICTMLDEIQKFFSSYKAGEINFVEAMVFTGSNYDQLSSCSSINKIEGENNARIGGKKSSFFVGWMIAISLLVFIFIVFGINLARSRSQAGRDDDDDEENHNLTTTTTTKVIGSGGQNSNHHQQQHDDTDSDASTVQHPMLHSSSVDVPHCLSGNCMSCSNCDNMKGGKNRIKWIKVGDY